MASNSSNSRFKFLWVDITFSKEEKKWYRLLIIILALATTIIILLKLKEWIAPVVALDKIFHFKISSILSLFKKQ